MHKNPSNSNGIDLRTKSLPQLDDYFNQSITILQNVKHALDLQTHMPTPEEDYIAREMRASAELMANDCIAIQGEILRRAELN